MREAAPSRKASRSRPCCRECRCGSRLRCRRRQAASFFSPDGSSSGGGVALGVTGQQLDVNADWLTGKVQIDAP